MHRFSGFIFVLLFLFQTGAGSLNAQVSSFPTNWDEDIATLRGLAAPGFHYKADDYIQYAPAVVMAGLKACGYESRTGWGQMLVSDAFSVAIMAGVVNAIKYGVNRTRPNGADASFPSGHTATAFMTAALLDKEYGWRSPWFSIGGYTAAAFVGVSRILNNRHWMSDIAAGAAIGIGSVHLGYYLSDLIFKGKYVNSAYQKPEFSYAADQKHYAAELLFGRRFTMAGSDIVRGGLAALTVNIPVIPETGVAIKAAANSLTHRSGNTTGLYTLQAGPYYAHHFARRLEAQANVLVGCGWHGAHIGTDVSAGLSLSFLLDDNFKIKAFADYETASLAPQKPWMQSFVLGWGSAWFF